MNKLCSALIALLFMAAQAAAERGYYGEFAQGESVPIIFSTYTQAGELVAPSSAFADGDFKIYKNGNPTPRSSTAGWTVSSPFSATTGKHCLTINLADNTDAGFYTSGDTYTVRLAPAGKTVDGVAVDVELGTFSINRTQFETLATIITYMGEFADSLNNFSDDLSEVADQVGNATVSPFLSDDKHAWHFTRRDQMTSPEILVETKSAAIIKTMDFSGVLPEGSSIGTILSVAVADVEDATKPTITRSTLAPNKRKVDIEINASEATPATYTVAFTVRSPDSQEYTRYGRLVLQ